MATEPTHSTNGSGVHPDGKRDKPETTTHTRPFGSVESESSKDKTVEVKSADGVNSVHDAAVKAVIDMGGTEEQARANPNFDEKVKDAEKQIRDSIEATKGM